MENVQIFADGIKRSLNKYSVENAICEYIWNGFDAKANRVDIEFNKNSTEMAVDLTITDNGYGINRNDLKSKFKPFYQSEKEYNPNESRNTSAVHGKNGVGRLTFFKFAKSARWQTVYKDSNNKNYKYSINVNENSLEKYDASEQKETSEEAGTKVIFELNIPIYFDSVLEYIKTEFCWFLELNKNQEYSIYVNKEKLVYSDLIFDSDCFVYNSINDNKFTIDFVQWKEKINNEYSRYYFIDNNDKEINKDTTKLNNKGDRFFHSVYIRGEFFDLGFPRDKTIEGQLTLEQRRCRNDELKELLNEVNRFLWKKRKPFLKQYTEMLIDEYEKESVFPMFDNSIIGNYQKAELQNVVRELYQVEPKIFTNLNKTQKPTFVRLLNLILETGENDGLFEILSQIIELDELERNELADALKVSKLSNVVKTIKLIQDRYKAVNELRELVFNEDVYANEVFHLQRFIENHYWIFGEKYNLVTAAEPKFEEALRRYKYLLTGDDEKTHINSPDKNKEMDIFAVRVNMNSGTVNNIIVELKHPDKKLGEKEFNQVKKYLNVIKNEPEFNTVSANWDFILVGNSLDKSNYIQGEYDNAKNHGEKALAYKSGNFKIYVKLWSEIFDEFECNHNFLNEKLKIERNRIIVSNKSANEIVEQIAQNTARQRPELVIVK
ncbi:ATP-binding protein [Ruminiclostridium cellobioparum]|uniref:ATP-binding protein n=1 Tax=Ruminiclostridium cellobioparum TaxID=29355 RepID=UPI0028ACC7AE|nr:ATP-binding protein [Ruminiclostridium cellobioparum]